VALLAAELTLMSSTDDFLAAGMVDFGTALTALISPGSVGERNECTEPSSSEVRRETCSLPLVLEVRRYSPGILVSVALRAAELNRTRSVDDFLSASVVELGTASTGLISLGS